jgi:hypothetical protein
MNKYRKGSPQEPQQPLHSEAAAAAMPGAVKPSLGGKSPRVTLWRGMRYHEFRALLLGLGFHQVDKPGPFPAFREASSGALVILPSYADDEAVSTLDLNGFRQLVLEKGLADSVAASGLER